MLLRTATANTPLVVTNPRTGRRYAIPHSVDIDSYEIDDLPPENEATDDSPTGLAAKEPQSSSLYKVTKYSLAETALHRISKD
jgi:hypothetical protein